MPGMITATSVAHPEVGADGTPELVRLWQPQVPPRAEVVLVHGLYEHSGRYERTGRLMAEAGFRVRSFDLYGHGASGGERCDIDDWGRFLDQIDRQMVQAAGSGRPVVLFGHSIGGLLALDYVMTGHKLPQLMVLSSPAIGGAAAWQTLMLPWMVKVVPGLRAPIVVKGHQLSRDEQVGIDYFADPLVNTNATVRLGSEVIAAIDRVRKNMAALPVPTLVVHGGGDTLIPPGSSLILADVGGAERRLYPALRHEMLNEPEGPDVVADIVDWLDRRLTSSR
jgi:alpha-beta hydrolase superfamily lysophospholipase